MPCTISQEERQLRQKRMRKGQRGIESGIKLVCAKTSREWPSPKDSGSQILRTRAYDMLQTKAKGPSAQGLPVRS